LAKHLKSIRWILAVVVLPFAVLGLLALATQLLGLVCYDPAYFTPTYVECYQAANASVRSLERILHRGNRAPLVQQEDLRRPVPLSTGGWRAGGSSSGPGRSLVLLPGCGRLGV